MRCSYQLSGECYIKQLTCQLRFFFLVSVPFLGSVISPSPHSIVLFSQNRNSNLYFSGVAHKFKVLSSIRINDDKNKRLQVTRGGSTE